VAWVTLTIVIESRRLGSLLKTRVAAIMEKRTPLKLRDGRTVRLVLAAQETVRAADCARATTQQPFLDPRLCRVMAARLVRTLLHAGDDVVKAYAARTLGLLAFMSEPNKVAVADAGGIAPLVDVARGGGAAAAPAAWALAMAAIDCDANLIALHALGALDQIRPFVALG